MNRLEQHLAAINPTLPVRREPVQGELCFGMLMWRARRDSKWIPPSVDAVPPLIGGRFTILWSIARDLPPVLRDVIDSNVESLKRANKRGRVRTWAVPVQAVYGFDETARIVDVKGGAL